MSVVRPTVCTRGRLELTPSSADVRILDRRKWSQLARAWGQFGQFYSRNITFYTVDVCWIYLAVCCSSSHQTSPSSGNTLCRYLLMVLQLSNNWPRVVSSTAGGCGGFRDGYSCEYLNTVHQHFIHVNKFIPLLWDVFIFFFFKSIYLYIFFPIADNLTGCSFSFFILPLDKLEMNRRGVLVK